MRMGYGDHFPHQEYPEKMFLCRSVCIVITSLIKRKSDGSDGGLPIIKRKSGIWMWEKVVKFFFLDSGTRIMLRSL